MIDRIKRECSRSILFLIAKALQAKLCLHEISFAGLKNSEKLASN